MVQIKKETDYVLVEWVVNRGISRLARSTYFLKADWEAMTDEQKNKAIEGAAKEMFEFLGIPANG